MENYGRKIIDYIFGKRSNSSTISYEREQKVQADSDRSDIRVFETGISPQRHGNIRQSSRAAEEEECNRLISIAKENNLYIDKADWDKFGNRRMYRFIGISEDIKGIRIVLQQKNISSMFRVPTPKMIDDYLRNVLGLSKEDKYFYGNEYLAITDISNLSDNVLCDENGKLFFIDPIIRLKRPAQEVWDYLYNSRCI